MPLCKVLAWPCLNRILRFIRFIWSIFLLDACLWGWLFKFDYVWNLLKIHMLIFPLKEMYSKITSVIFFSLLVLQALFRMISYLFSCIITFGFWRGGWISFGLGSSSDLTAAKYQNLYFEISINNHWTLYLTVQKNYLLRFLEQIHLEEY